MKKIEYKIGDIETVEFIKNQREGKKPICRLNGVVCFIDKTFKGQFIQEHSIWHVEIVQVNEKTMVVNPIQIVKSAAQNQCDINKRMQDLLTEHPPKHKKLKVKYPYLSKQEQLDKK